MTEKTQTNKKSISKLSIFVPPPPPEPKQYFLHNANDRAELALLLKQEIKKQVKYIYKKKLAQIDLLNCNKEQKKKRRKILENKKRLTLATCTEIELHTSENGIDKKIYIQKHGLGVGYAAFAASRIKANPRKIFSYYSGDIIADEKFNRKVIKIISELKTQYAFSFEVGDNEYVLDASKHRNISVFYNHSRIESFSHDEPSARLKDLTKAKGFKLVRDIKKDEALFINYGDNFFDALGIKEIYLDSSDNWRTYANIYHENIASYLKNKPFFLSKDLNDAFEFNKAPALLATKLWWAVYQKNHGLIKTLLKAKHNPDGLSFALEKKNNRLEIKSSFNQQHITPLMLACYLGDARAASLLISKGANVNRRAFLSGNVPLFFVITGKGTLADKLSLIDLILAKEPYLNLVNAHELTLFNYAVKLGDEKIIRKLLKNSYKDVQEELIESALKAAKSYALTQLLAIGKTDLFIQLLQKYDQQKFAEKILTKKIDVNKLIKKLPAAEKDKLIVYFKRLSKTYRKLAPIIKKIAKLR